MNNKELDDILFLFYDKSQEKRTDAIKLLEKFFQDNSDKNKLNESLLSFIQQIKKRIFSPTYLQIIIKGDMAIFLTLFNILKKFNNVEPEVYFIIIEPLLKMIKENDDKLIITSSNTLIKLLKLKDKIFINYFNVLFEHLIILKQIKNQIIGNYANALDEFLKDLIGKYFELISSNKNNSNNTFSIKYLSKKLNEANHPIIQILIISWITFIISIPENNLILYCNKIIPELFDMLTDPVEDVNQSSEQCLKKIYVYIEIQFEKINLSNPKIINGLSEVLIERCKSTYDNVKSCAFEWLNMFLSKYKEIIDSYIKLNEKNINMDKEINDEISTNINSTNLINSNNLTNSNNLNINVNSDNNISNNNINDNNVSDNKINVNNNDYKNSTEYKNKKLLISIGLMDKQNNDENINPNELINIIPFQIFPKILEVLIYNRVLNLNNNNKILVQNCNEIFQSIVLTVPFHIFVQNVKKLESKLKDFLLPLESDSVINFVLDLTVKLFNRFHFSMFNKVEDYLEKLINIIPEKNKEIFNNILTIFCKIAKYNESHTEKIISLLIEKFRKSPNLINVYGITMLKTLSKAISITTIYKTITNNLLKYNDLQFKIRMINILDTFLFIEKEGEEVRKKLRNITNERNEDDFIFFKQIFTLFSIKPISTLMMCIISNYFELSFYLSLELAKMDLKQDDYFQIFQMIQLFESIIFHPIRIKLITPKKNIFLVKTLNAILFILPQGEAFKALKKRLIFVPVIFSLDKEKELIEKGNAVDNYDLDEKKKNDVSLFINIFKEVQDY